jgi:hypothetical protein
MTTETLIDYAYKSMVLKGSSCCVPEHEFRFGPVKILLVTVSDRSVHYMRAVAALLYLKLPQPIYMYERAAAHMF